MATAATSERLLRVVREGGRNEVVEPSPSAGNRSGLSSCFSIFPWDTLGASVAALVCACSDVSPSSHSTLH